jgi:hypothetical protein
MTPPAASWSRPARMAAHDGGWDRRTLPATFAVLVALLLVVPQPTVRAAEGDTVGVRRGSEFLLRSELRGGAADHVITFGRASDVPVVGDWNGDGTDTVGVRRGHTFHLRNTHAGGPADTSFVFGRAEDVVVSRSGLLQRPFSGDARPLPASVRRAMTGVSWHPGCPVGLDDLSLLTLTHHGFDGQVHTGEMVVASRVAPAILGVFRELYSARFPIQRMRRIEHYGGDDDASMAANNSSAFNCRRVTGGSAWSEHAYGTAIDLNPVQNPYVRGSTVLPPAGSSYVNRTNVRPGMIVRPGPVVGAFERIGWGWGGDWASLKDYMHFSERGR